MPFYSYPVNTLKLGLRCRSATGFIVQENTTELVVNLLIHSVFASSGKAATWGIKKKD